MRIAIVNSIRETGGGEKWLVRQAPRWRDAGHEPLIVCQPGSGLEGMARERSLAVAPVRMRHDVSLPSVAGVRSALRKLRPEAILCCNERAFRLTVPAALGFDAPVVYRNGLSATFKDRWINRFYGRRLARMVVNTDDLRREMAAFGWIPHSRLQVINNGIDPSLYDPAAPERERVRREVGAAPEAAVAAVIARLTEDKGQLELIDAFAELARGGTPAELWIVGEGSLLPRLQARAAEQGVAERVRFLGFRPDIPAVLQAVDLVVLASRREGLANTVLEAMAAARPVLATAVGGVPDVVVPGTTGEMIPPRDPAALLAGLRSLLSHADRRRAYGEAGRRRVEEHFRLEHETAAWLAVFEQVAALRTAGPAAAPKPSREGLR